MGFVFLQWTNPAVNSNQWGNGVVPPPNLGNTSCRLIGPWEKEPGLVESAIISGLWTACCRRQREIWFRYIKLIPDYGWFKKSYLLANTQRPLISYCYSSCMSKSSITQVGCHFSKLFRCSGWCKIPLCDLAMKPGLVRRSLWNLETGRSQDHYAQAWLLLTVHSNAVDDLFFHVFPTTGPLLPDIDTIWYLAVCQNLVPLVNPKIAGKWMFIPLKMVSIGIDPYPLTISLGYQDVYQGFRSTIFWTKEAALRRARSTLLSRAAGCAGGLCNDASLDGRGWRTGGLQQNWRRPQWEWNLMKPWNWGLWYVRNVSADWIWLKTWKPSLLLRL